MLQTETVFLLGKIMFFSLFLPVIFGMISYLVWRRLWIGIVVGLAVTTCLTLIFGLLDYRLSIFAGGEGYGTGIILVIGLIYIGIALVELLISKRKG